MKAAQKVPWWPGLAMFLTGTGGLFVLLFTVSPRAALIAAVIVVIAFCLLMALGAVVAAGRADEQIRATSPDYEVSVAGRRYAEQCMNEIRMRDAEEAASAVIGDDH